MKKILIIYGCALLLFTNKTSAQTNAGLARQTDSSLYYVNGEGAFLHLGKTDGATFNLLTTVQSGFQYNRLDSTNGLTNSNRMSLNLVRISLTAKGFKDKMSVGVVTDLTGVSPILEGWVSFFLLNNRAKITLGQKQSISNNRLAMSDERYAMLGQTIGGKSTDGTVYGGLMQNFVGATREGGLFFETFFRLNKVKIYPYLSITTGEGQNFFTPQPNLGFKYSGRLDIMPLGDFIKNNAYIANDLYRERKPKLAFGVAGSFNIKASSPIGSETGLINGIYNQSGTQDYANYRKLVADFVFKYNGFALVGEYINGTVYGNNLYTNVGATNKLTPQIASSYYSLGSGFNVQSSYISKNGWAIDGRYSHITPEFSLTSSIVHTQNWYTVGISKYLKNNAVKIGLNSTYIDDSTPAMSYNKWVSNFALQFLF